MNYLAVFAPWQPVCFSFFFFSFLNWTTAHSQREQSWPREIIWQLILMCSHSSLSGDFVLYNSQAVQSGKKRGKVWAVLLFVPTEKERKTFATVWFAKQHNREHLFFKLPGIQLPSEFALCMRWKMVRFSFQLLFNSSPWSGKNDRGIKYCKQSRMSSKASVRSCDKTSWLYELWLREETQYQTIKDAAKCCCLKEQVEIFCLHLSCNGIEWKQ